MDSFRELQMIYEGYRGHSVQPTSQTYPTVQSNHSYKGPLPGQTSSGQGPVMSTIPTSDEEGAVISKKAIKNKILSLIQSSDASGLDPKHLFELLSFIEKS